LSSGQSKRSATLVMEGMIDSYLWEFVIFVLLQYACGLPWEV
jgi:hypothetical protein